LLLLITTGRALSLLELSYVRFSDTAMIILDRAEGAEGPKPRQLEDVLFVSCRTFDFGLPFLPSPSCGSRDRA